MPKTRTEYWQEKFVKNVARDIAVQASLAAIGWKVHVIWECELNKDTHRLDVADLPEEQIPKELNNSRG